MGDGERERWLGAFPRMREALETGEAIDVSQFPMRAPDGTERDGMWELPPELDIAGKDLCDATRGRWVWSVGLEPATGRRFASVGSHFHSLSTERPAGFECVWLR